MRLESMKKTGCFLILIVIFAPQFSYTQTKLKIKEGIHRHTFKSGDEIEFYRNVYDELGETGKIHEFTETAIILGETDQWKDTIPLDEIYTLCAKSRNIQYNESILLPIGLSLITLYISPFTGFTKDGYKPKNVIIVGGSAIAFNGIVFGIASIGRTRPFNLCKSKVKFK